MRKNISVTNPRVLKAMEESENASKLIENAVVSYLDDIEKQYVTQAQLEEVTKKVEILVAKYALYEELLFNISKQLKLNTV